MRRISVVLSVVAGLLVVGVLAYRSAPAADVPEVLVGELLPLTGNFAALGQQYLWAGQTVEDVVRGGRYAAGADLGPVPDRPTA